MEQSLKAGQKKLIANHSQVWSALTLGGGADKKVRRKNGLTYSIVITQIKLNNFT